MPCRCRPATVLGAVNQQGTLSMLQTDDCKWQEAALAAARVESCRRSQPNVRVDVRCGALFSSVLGFQASLRPAPPRDLGWGAGMHLFSVFRETWHCSKSSCPHNSPLARELLHSVYKAGFGPFAGGQPAHSPSPGPAARESM